MVACWPTGHATDQEHLTLFAYGVSEKAITP
jgi:hypothetical protein